jgi:hypothetical protein
MPENTRESHFAFEQAISLARVEEKIVALEENQERVEKEYQGKISDLKEKVEGLTKERDRALRWGLVLLGSSVLSMFAWIVKLISGGKLPIP